jgi:glutamyl-tRNA synthetase
VRTALYNYLFAKQQGGKFILRIEDTDQNRFVAGAESYIGEALTWLGIIPDEGVLQGGAHGPYRQSERKALYQKYADHLLANGHAYYAFDTQQDLQAMRERLKGSKEINPVYDSHTRESMINSLTLGEAEVQKRLEQGDPYVVRLKVPANEQVVVDDLIRGAVVVDTHNMDDKILLKSDGMPTYHLANVVDDHLMEISHVIRGEEWLPSTPLHVLLYKYLGWIDKMPAFAHLPLLLKPDGNGKLSKRDADKHGYPVFPMDWKDPESGENMMGFKGQGYLPDALVNFLVLLGWNPGTEEEFFTMNQLIDTFTIERIGKSGAKFDIEKARWFNQHYIRQVPDEALAVHYQALLEKDGITCDRSKALAITKLMKERITFADEIWTAAKYFQRPPDQYDQKIVKKKWTPDVVILLQAFSEELLKAEQVNAQSAMACLHQVMETHDKPLGSIMQPLRLALTGVGAGPDLMGIAEVLGKEEVLKRIDKAIDTIK